MGIERRIVPEDVERRRTMIPEADCVRQSLFERREFEVERGAAGRLVGIEGGGRALVPQTITP